MCRTFVAAILHRSTRIVLLHMQDLRRCHSAPFNKDTVLLLVQDLRRCHSAPFNKKSAASCAGPSSLPFCTGQQEQCCFLCRTFVAAILHRSTRTVLLHAQDLRRCHSAPFNKDSAASCAGPSSLQSAPFNKDTVLLYVEDLRHCQSDNKTR